MYTSFFTDSEPSLDGQVGRFSSTSFKAQKNTRKDVSSMHFDVLYIYICHIYNIYIFSNMLGLSRDILKLISNHATSRLAAGGFPAMERT